MDYYNYKDKRYRPMFGNKTNSNQKFSCTLNYFLHLRLEQIVLACKRTLIGLVVLLGVYILFGFLFFEPKLDFYERLNDNSGRKVHLKIDRKEASIIIDALIQPADIESQPTVYSLINEDKHGIFLYNMDEPVESWWPFECIETRMKQSINTRICIHDPKYDKHISASLKENGLWEPTNVRSFLRQLHETPDAHVMDIGANIGLYTLLAAKLNRTVIAVEPLHENLNRLHKAAELEGVKSRIVALVNAISNERKQLQVSLMDYNIGGSYVAQAEIIDPEQKYSPTSSSVLVNSILMDDLVDVIRQKFKLYDKQDKREDNPSLNSSNETRAGRTERLKFVIKLDIEGYEPFAIEKSKRVFSEFDIVAIFMEMGKILEKIKNGKTRESPNDQEQAKETLTQTLLSYKNRIINMLDNLKKLNYEPYEVNGINKLEYNQWLDWPWDVYFRQCDLLPCPGHTYKLSGF